MVYHGYLYMLYGGYDRLEEVSLKEQCEGRPMTQQVVVQPRTDRAIADLYAYINESLKQNSKLTPFALTNETVITLAKWLRRHATGSQSTLRSYIYRLNRYCEYVGKTPDQLIAECKDIDGILISKTVSLHERMLDDWIGELKAYNITDGSIAQGLASVKSFYEKNGIILNVKSPRNYSRVVYRDSAPTPEQLARLLEVANLREKVIVSILALSGIRESTLCKLEYRHIKEDYEKGIIPIHVHVEVTITKGQYGDYDTFIGKEAAEYLKLYLEERRQGNPRCNIPPETITDSSPLISMVGKAKPLTPRTVGALIHYLYAKAGLISLNNSRRYQYRGHSIRKFFKTQLAALGVQSDYVEYMMGHKISIYHDIQSRGIEFLRNIYAASSFAIKPKTAVSKIETLKEIMRSMGLNPEELLVKKAQAEPHRIIAAVGEQRENEELTILRYALKDALKKEIMEDLKIQPINSSIL